jgi:MFS transporter, PAT family, solute carrier family 33 (acetyl-CoA transportor), member 1
MQLAIGFTALVFLCATQDIAVDGWAVELLTDENKTYASTAQSIGLNAGYFLSFTVFLAFNSPEFCNTYIYSTAQLTGLISLGGYLQFWGLMFLLCNVYLYFFTKEQPVDHNLKGEISSAYKTIFSLLSKPRTFI